MAQPPVVRGLSHPRLPLPGYHRPTLDEKVSRQTGWSEERAKRMRTEDILTATAAILSHAHDFPSQVETFRHSLAQLLAQAPEARGELHGVLLHLVREDADGDVARSYALLDKSPEALRRFVREAAEEVGLLTLAIAEAKALLNRAES